MENLENLKQYHSLNLWSKSSIEDWINSFTPEVVSYPEKVMNSSPPLKEHRFSGESLFPFLTNSRKFLVSIQKEIYQNRTSN